ncbi:MAG: hypothetical protein AAGF45_08535 [Pseudomonadota bacterium]
MNTFFTLHYLYDVMVLSYAGFIQHRHIPFFADDANLFVSRGEHLPNMGAKATAMTLSHLLDQTKASATTADMMEAMPAAQEPKERVALPAMANCPSFPEEPRIYPVAAESPTEATINPKSQERPGDGFSPLVSDMSRRVPVLERAMVRDDGPQEQVIASPKSAYTEMPSSTLRATPARRQERLRAA